MLSGWLVRSKQMVLAVNIEINVASSWCCARSRVKRKGFSESEGRAR